MKRSEMQVDSVDVPDCAALHPGYADDTLRYSKSFLMFHRNMSEPRTLSL